MSEINITAMMNALANLKGIPLRTVVKNAAKDYVQGAYQATPIASISRSEWYVATKGDKKWYVPESQVAGRRIRNKDGKTRFVKTRIRKGWSRATWLGAMRGLGMATKPLPARIHMVATHRSYAFVRSNIDNPSATIVDQFRIDDFGRSTSEHRHQEIARAGLRLAALRVQKEYTRMLKEAWRG